MPPDELWTILTSELGGIDRFLAESNVPLRQRPTIAAHIFVEECVIEFQGISKKEFFSTGTFRDIVRRTQEWFVERYGKDLMSLRDGGRDRGIGVLSIFATPFKLRFPLTLSWWDTRRKLVAVSFTRVVLRREDSLDFLVHAPNIGQFSRSSVTQLRRRIGRIVGLTRRLSLDLEMARFRDKAHRSLAMGIRPHLEKGIEDICSGVDARLGPAVWEFYIAVEKALKTFIWQRAGKPRHIHDLNVLVESAVSSGLGPLPISWLRAFPPEKQAIALRYGQGRPPTSDEVMAAYSAALRACAHRALALERSIHVGGRGATIWLSPQ